VNRLLLFDQVPKHNDPLRKASNRLQGSTEAVSNLSNGVMVLLRRSSDLNDSRLLLILKNREEKKTTRTTNMNNHQFSIIFLLLCFVLLK